MYFYLDHFMPYYRLENIAYKLELEYNLHMCIPAELISFIEIQIFKRFVTCRVQS